MVAQFQISWEEPRDFIQQNSSLQEPGLCANRGFYSEDAMPKLKKDGAEKARLYDKVVVQNACKLG